MTFHRLAPLAAALLFLAPVAARAATPAVLTPQLAPNATFDQGMLHVERYGSGSQSIVLIPGLGSGPWEWYGTIARFAPSYTIYALTIAGFDGRPAGSLPQTFDAFATDFWDLLHDRAIDRPVVVGHSLGGTLALYLAEQHPERLRAVVAVDGLPIFPPVASLTPIRREATAQSTAASIASQTPAAFAAYELHFMQTVGTRDPAIAAAAAKLEAASDPKAVAGWVAADLGEDLRPQLARITIPVLEIMPFDPETGRQLGYSQDQALAFYRALMPGLATLQLVPIAPARHFAMLDRPQPFYDALDRFLTQLGP
ncbi:MAG TPA: alpha/beta hydrolase [Candidatus Acidoferrales bacterium]|nr:alpha/beta hydrolase [Candidatus Acidoferrales bacterium]